MRSLYAASLAIAAGLIATFEWRTDEDAITLGSILLTSGALGAFRPKAFWLSGLVLGSVVFWVQLVSLLTGWRPIYLGGHAGSPAHVDWTMLVLIVPAVVAAGVGAALAHAASPRAT